MSKKCVESGDYDLTEGEYYQILDQNPNGSFKVVDDNDEVVWVPEHYFA